MAGTFTLKSHSYDGRYLKLVCEQTRNISSNTSTIDWTLESTGGNANYYTTGPTKVKIAGVTVYSKAKTAWDSYKFPAAKGSTSGSTVISHDDSGNASITLSIETAIYNGVSKTTSDIWSLDSIQRFARLLSATDFNDEENPTITYTNPAGDAITKLEACISLDGTNPDIAYRSISKTDSSYTFQLTESERNVLRNATTGGNSRQVLFRIRSYIGTDSKASDAGRVFTIKNPMPVINYDIADINSTTKALTGDANKLVRYASTAQVVIGASAVKGAELIGKKVRCGEVTLAENGTISGVPSDTFTFIAADNRGNRNELSVTVPFVWYIKPTCLITKNMPDTDGNLVIKATGNYFNGHFGASNNALNVYYRYKPASASWSDLHPWTLINNVTLGTNTYSATTTISGLDYQTAYTVQTYARDVLESTDPAEYTAKASPVFDWGENDFKFNVPVYDRFGKEFRNGLVYTGNDPTVLDPNTVLEELCLTAHENGPGGAGQYYMVRTMFYNEKSLNASRVQIAYPYSGIDTLFHRNYNRNSNTWSKWIKIATIDDIQYLTSTENPNTTTKRCLLTNINTPVSGKYMFIHTIFAGDPTATTLRTQIAFPYESISSTYYRWYNGSNWSTWRKQLTDDNKYVEIKKIWANAEPNSTFAAKTITTSDSPSNYDMIMIFFRNASDTTAYLSTGMIPVGYKTIMTYTTTSGDTVYSRAVNINTDSIGFEEGKSNGTTASKMCIPLAIYGIKGVT